MKKIFLTAIISLFSFNAFADVIIDDSNMSKGEKMALSTAATLAGKSLDTVTIGNGYKDSPLNDGKTRSFDEIREFIDQQNEKNKPEKQEPKKIDAYGIKITKQVKTNLDKDY